MSSALEALEAEKEVLSCEADSMKSHCHKQEQHIKELMKQVSSSPTASFLLDWLVKAIALPRDAHSPPCTTFL